MGFAQKFLKYFFIDFLKNQIWPKLWMFDPPSADSVANLPRMALSETEVLMPKRWPLAFWVGMLPKLLE
jgi:hypothetical protein